MTTRIFKVWKNRIERDDVWEHGKIRQWSQSVYSLAEYGVASGHATALHEDEAEDLVRLFHEKYPDRFDGPLVTESQAEIGRNWLATKGVRFGLRRDVDWRSITHFRFVGVYGYEGGYRPYCTPVYAGFLPNGDAIRYHATPWQTFSDFEFELHEGATA